MSDRTGHGGARSESGVSADRLVALLSQVLAEVAGRGGHEFLRLLAAALARALAEPPFASTRESPRFSIVIGEWTGGADGGLRVLAAGAEAGVGGDDATRSAESRAGESLRAELAKGATIVCAQSARARFADSELLRAASAESLVATPLVFRNDPPVGVLLALGAAREPAAEAVGVLLSLIAPIVAAELERGRVGREQDPSQLRYQRIFERAAVGIARVTTEGVILEVNPSFARIVGHGAQELVGKRIRDITHPDDWPRNAVLIHGAVAGEYPTYSYEKRYVRQDGSEVWTQLSSALVRDAAGRPDYIIGVIQDISERKQLEFQLLQAQKLDSLGRLAGGIAHDFNNLLTVMLSYVDLAAAANDAAMREKCLENIRTAGERAAALTAQLLAFARKGGRTGGSVDLRAALQETGGLLRPLLGERIELAITVPQGPIGARIDAEKLQQVLVNLSVNARDAMRGSGRLAIEVETRDIDGRGEPLAPGRYARILVRDDGVGMTDEVRRQIFEPFFTTKGVGGGLGMGLATCYGIVRGAGGHISAESGPGRGTTMHVWLPWIDPTTLARAAPMRPVEGGRETVLVVEDEPTVRDVLVQGLDSFGYHVIAPGSPREALEAVREHRGAIDLCVLDVVMPQMSGPALARELRALRPDARFLFVSGYSGDRLAEIDFLGGDELLHKPFSQEALGRAVRRVLAGEA